MNFLIVFVSFVFSLIVFSSQSIGSMDSTIYASVEKDIVQVNVYSNRQTPDGNTILVQEGSYQTTLDGLSKRAQEISLEADRLNKIIMQISNQATLSQ